MTLSEWQVLSLFRDDFKAACKDWLYRCGYTYSAPAESQPALPYLNNSTEGTPLHLLQQEAAKADGTPFYPVETPIVYNHSLDEVQEADHIKLIIISDNPGKNEQLHINQR